MAEESIFAHALAIAEPAGRDAYLSQVCAGDPGLRQRVEALLRAYDAAGPFLQTPAVVQLWAADVLPADPTEPVEVRAAGPRTAAAPVAAWDPAETQADDKSGRPAGADSLDFLEPSDRHDVLGRLAHYEVLEILGKGGFGVVLKAFDTKLRRVVAIKVLARALAANDRARLRFLREARATAAVRHEHVVDIHAVDEQPVPYLVMEYIAGQTLQARLDREAPLDVRAVLRLGYQIATGLAAAHQQGLVHRDIKPANILLEDGVERVKITDFGLAQAADDPSLTQAGQVTGTPLYMAPEQASGAAVDHRADLFSLGTVLYLMCTGRRAFRAETTLAVLRRVCEDTPEPIGAINPDVPAWLAAIIARLHAKDPAQRIASAQELAQILERNLTELQRRVSDASTPAPGASAPGLPGLEPATAPPARPGARLWRATGVALTALVGLALAEVAGVTDVANTIAAWLRAGGHVVKSRPDGGADRPEPPRVPSATELARRPSPLDGRPREMIPRSRLAVFGGGEPATPERVVLPGDGLYRLPRREMTHWPGQSADGRLLALPWGNAVVIFDVANGSVIRTLTGHPDRAFQGAFRPDGRQFACGCQGHAVRIWDVATGREVRTLAGHVGAVYGVAFNPHGDRLASGSRDGTIKLWDATTGDELFSLAGHGGPVLHLTFSADGSRLVTVGEDGLGAVWNAATGERVETLHGHTHRGVRQAVFSPDGRFLATGSEAEVIVWHCATWKALRTLPAGGGGLLGFTADSKGLVAARHGFGAADARALTRWDVRTGDPDGTVSLPGHGGLLVGRLSTDGTTAFVMAANGTDDRLGAYDARTGAERLPPHRHAGPALAVAFRPDGGAIASGGVDALVRLRDLVGWRTDDPHPPTRVLTGHAGAVGAIAFRPDGEVLASGSTDGSIILWDVAGGKPLRTLAGPARTNFPLAFSPDGRLLAAGGEDGTVQLWDVDGGKPPDRLGGHAGPVHAVAFSPDGTRLASAGKDQTILIRELAPGRPVALSLRTPAGAFLAVAFSPDGKKLAATTGAPAAQLRVWDLGTRAEVVGSGHAGHVHGLAFHPAGHSLVTASADGTIRCWNFTGVGARALAIGPGLFGKAVRQVAFSPEGRFVATANDDGTVAILRVPEPW